jgi:hypothetical protein
MAQVQRHRRAIAAAFLGLAALAFAPAFAEDQGPNAKTDLYDRPVLAIDPGMHTAKIDAQAVDAESRFAVTGSDDRTVRIWSVADGKLLRTIWIPVGPEKSVTCTQLRSARTDRRSPPAAGRSVAADRARSICSTANPETLCGGLGMICPKSLIFSRFREMAATSPPR